MFTKEDYKEYFEQIARCERDMLFAVQDALLLIKDENIRSTIERVARAEVRHYSYIKGICDSLLLTNETEKRQHDRKYLLGTVLIRSSQGEIRGKCMDISESGVRVECDKSIPVGDNLELHIDLYEEKEKLRRSGKIVWLKQVNPSCYIGGVQFKSQDKI